MNLRDRLAAGAKPAPLPPAAPSDEDFAFAARHSGASRVGAWIVGTALAALLAICAGVLGAGMGWW